MAAAEHCESGVFIHLVSRNLEAYRATYPRNTHMLYGRQLKNKILAKTTKFEDVLTGFDAALDTVTQARQGTSRPMFEPLLFPRLEGLGLSPPGLTWNGTAQILASRHGIQPHRLVSKEHCSLQGSPLSLLASMFALL